MSACAKWELQELWKAVEKPCGKPAANADLHHVSEEINLFYGAAVDALSLLGARVEALENNFAQLLGVLDQPLSPTESLERLRQLREQMV